MKKYLISAVVMIALIGLSWTFLSGPATISGAAVADNIQATVYKSQSCGCCNLFISTMKRNGFDVKTVVTEDRSSLRAKYDIPYSMGSCHTTIIGDYFIEGHVPMEVIFKLLEEKPDIDGIALPGMPSGSPGMPGPKTVPFDITAIKDGKSQGLFITV
jgi:hypothetical protein